MFVSRNDIVRFEVSSMCVNWYGNDGLKMIVS